MKNQDYLIAPSRRKRLETQGYIGFTDAELYNFKFGIRFAYYLCGSLVLFGLLFTSRKILSVALVIAAIGAFPPYHPFDYLYNYAVRHLRNKPRMPPRANQGRFACAIATVWLAGTIYLFYLGLNTWGYIAGGILVIIATLVSTTDICIPSMIYNFLFKARQAKYHLSSTNKLIQSNK
ncbi:MAG: DUF4395 domain-containing protein [Bacteroidota bacterium]|nr:DUF4395 domain-containing protein [Bacteroidota bacterium]